MGSLYLRDLRRIRRPAALFLIGSAFMGAAHVVPWTLLGLFLDRLGQDKESIGRVIGAEAWGQVLIAVPGAVLLARRRTPPLLVLSCLVTSISYGVLPYLESSLGMQLCRLIGGCGWWLHHVAIAPFLYRHSSEEERPTLFGLADAVHTGAGVLAALSCGRLADAVDLWGWADETGSLGLVLSLGGLLPLVAAVVYARIREDEPEADRRRPLLPLLREHRGLVLRFVLPQWIVACGAGLCIPFLGLYFQDRFERPPTTIGDLYAAWQGLATLGFLLSPILVRRLGFAGSIVAVELASIPFFLILAFTDHYALAIFAFLMRGALMNTAHPILKNFMMEASPAAIRTLQVALNGMAWGTAWVVGPALGGAILDRTGNSYALLMCTTVGFYVCATLSTLLLLRPLDPRRRRAGGAPARTGL